MEATTTISLAFSSVLFVVVSAHLLILKWLKDSYMNHNDIDVVNKEVSYYRDLSKSLTSDVASLKTTLVDVSNKLDAKVNNASTLVQEEIKPKKKNTITLADGEELELQLPDFF